MIVRMSKAIGSKYLQEELTKVSQLDGKPTDATFVPKLGDLVLVYFPEGSGSKLIPNWKGIYRIKEKLDHNTFIVTLTGHERKKFIVHRHRIRCIKGLKAQNTQDSAESDNTDKTSINDTDVRHATANASGEASSRHPEKEPSTTGRPKRNAALRARHKMINMR